MTAVECPYVGLVPFREEDARFFFGRSTDQTRLIANLFAARLTILYGASGVGKSSLLRAGVVKELDRRAAEARGAPGDPEPRVVYFKQWHEGPVAPVARLKTRICECAGIEDGSLAEASLDDVLARAAPPPSGDTSGSGDLMVLLDQFEDYFKYPEAGPRTFATELATALSRPGLAVSFLISLREDQLSRLDRFQRLIPNLFANALRVDPLSGEQAAEAIRRPLETYNALAPDERVHAGTFSVEDALVDAVVEQVRRGQVRIGDVGRGNVKGSTSTVVEAPYLQLVMMKIWAAEIAEKSRRLRADTLRRLGGAERIVQSHLDQVMRGLSRRQRGMSARIFEHLVTPGGNKIAHTTADLAKWAEAPEPEVDALLGALSGANARIVAPVAPAAGGGASQYEINHDALGPAVLDWRRRYTLRRRMREWGAEALFVAVLLSGWAWYQTRIAKDAAETARERVAAEERAWKAWNEAQTAKRTATEEAGKALAAQASLATILAERARSDEDAGRFRGIAEDATRTRMELQSRINQSVDSLDTANREIGRLRGQVSSTQQQLQRSQEEVKRLQAAPIFQPITVQLRLLKIRVVKDGSSWGAVDWKFAISAEKRSVLHVNWLTYSDRDPPVARPPVMEGDSTPEVGGQEGGPFTLTVAAMRRDHRTSGSESSPISGNQSVYLPRRSDWSQPLTVEVVVEDSPPARGSFVLELQLQPVTAAAR